MAKQNATPLASPISAGLKLRAFLDAELAQRDTSIDESIESCALLPMCDIEADAEEIGIDLSYKMGATMRLIKQQKRLYENSALRSTVVDVIVDETISTSPTNSPGDSHRQNGG